MKHVEDLRRIEEVARAHGAEVVASEIESASTMHQVEPWVGLEFADFDVTVTLNLDDLEYQARHCDTGKVLWRCRENDPRAVALFAAWLATAQAGLTIMEEHGSLQAERV